MMAPRFEVPVKGIALDTIGLDEVIIIYPNGYLTLLEGFPVRSGQGIVEALLAAYPCCELFADERALLLNVPIRIH